MSNNNRRRQRGRELSEQRQRQAIAEWTSSVPFESLDTLADIAHMIAKRPLLETDELVSKLGPKVKKHTKAEIFHRHYPGVSVFGHLDTYRYWEQRGPEADPLGMVLPEALQNTDVGPDGEELGIIIGEAVGVEPFGKGKACAALVFDAVTSERLVKQRTRVLGNLGIKGHRSRPHATLAFSNSSAKILALIEDIHGSGLLPLPVVLDTAQPIPFDPKELRVYPRVA